MAWPTSTRLGFWRGHLDAARVASAQVVRAVATFEPVLLVVEPGAARSARALVGTTDHEVELVELPIDDSWTRDNGPIVVVDPAGHRVGVDVGFNAWGAKLEPWTDDGALPARMLPRLGIERVEAPFILEGGSIVVDGTGRLVTTERCLLHPNRNPDLDRTEIEHLLAMWLGVDEDPVWLPDGLADDEGTDGHVDNVVAFHAPGQVLLQGCDDPDDPDHAGAAENRRRLEAAGIEVTEVAVLPRVECLGELVEVPYANLYVANGGVVVPVTGHAYDGEALRTIATCFPGRDVVGVPGEVLAFGGGGVHCITQQIPAGQVD
jgi:agmatine deiminase